MGFLQVVEFCLESCEFLLWVGQGLNLRLSQSHLHWNVVSIVNKRIGYVIEIRHLKFYFKKNLKLYIYI